MLNHSLTLDSEIAKYLKGREIIKIGDKLEGVVLNYNQDKKALIDFGSFRVLANVDNDLDVGSKLTVKVENKGQQLTLKVLNDNKSSQNIEKYIKDIKTQENINKLPFKIIRNILENIKEQKLVLNQNRETSLYSANSFRTIEMNLSSKSIDYLNNNSWIKEGQIYQGIVTNVSDKKFEAHFGAFLIKGEAENIFKKGDTIELLTKKENNKQLSLKLLVNQKSSIKETDIKNIQLSSIKDNKIDKEILSSMEKLNRDNNLKEEHLPKEKIIQLSGKILIDESAQSNSLKITDSSSINEVLNSLDQGEYNLKGVVTQVDGNNYKIDFSLFKLLVQIQNSNLEEGDSVTLRLNNSLQEQILNIPQDKLGETILNLKIIEAEKDIINLLNQLSKGKFIIIKDNQGPFNVIDKQNIEINKELMNIIKNLSGLRASSSINGVISSTGKENIADFGFMKLFFKSSSYIKPGTNVELFNNFSNNTISLNINGIEEITNIKFYRELLNKYTSQNEINNLNSINKQGIFALNNNEAYLNNREILELSGIGKDVKAHINNILSLINELSPLESDKSLLRGQIRKIVKDSGFFMEKKIEEILEKSINDKKFDLKGELTKLLQNDLKSNIDKLQEVLKKVLLKNEHGQKIIDDLGNKLQNLKENILHQQDKAIEKNLNPENNNQVFTFELPLKEERRGKLKVFYNKKNNSKNKGKKEFNISMLLNLQNLGSLRADFKQSKDNLRINLLLENEEIKNLFDQEMKELKELLNQDFKSLYISTLVSPQESQNLKRDEESFNENFILDIKA